MELLKRFWKEEDGIGVVEIILIIVVLIGLVLLFKEKIITFINNIFGKINTEGSKVW